MTAAIEAKEGRPSGSASVASPQAAIAAAAVWTIGQIRGRIRAGSARSEEITPYVLAHRRAGGRRSARRPPGHASSQPPALPARAVSRARAVAAEALLLLVGLGARGALAELDLQRLVLAAAADGHRDRLTGLVRVHQGGERGGVLDGLAADGGDHVPGLQAGARRGAARGDRGDLRARARAVLRGHAEVGVADLA